MASNSDRRIESETVDDPITYFLEELRFHGRSERTRSSYRRVLRRFEAFLKARDRRIARADRRDCLEWVHSLREGHASSTVATYASYVNRFYRYMVDVDVLDTNPMALVIAEMDETVDTDPARRDIGIDAMRAFCRSIRHPLDRAVVLTLLKTGVRVGELCNLDLRDVNIGSDSVVRAYDVHPRGALAEHERSLYVSAEPTRGGVVNGEERSASNKRQRDTVIPIDDELRAVLVRWLSIRPDSPSPARPLFVSTREWGRRLTPNMVRGIVQNHATAQGWYAEGGDPEENVTPHYFRHFFTTHLRDRTGDRGIVKYLRGDVAEDIIDTYTHNWGDRVRNTYEREIYQLL